MLLTGDGLQSSGYQIAKTDEVVVTNGFAEVSVRSQLSHPGPVQDGIRRGHDNHRYAAAAQVTSEMLEKLITARSRQVQIE
jgi:hypothetical protein